MAKATYKPADDGAAPRARKAVDSATAVARAVTGISDDKLPAEDEQMVKVNVREAFRLTDDGHHVHEYGAGPQEMRQSHAEHWYTRHFLRPVQE